MKKYFFMMSVLICLFCFGLALSILHLVPETDREKELLVYRNGRLIQDSLSEVDEKVIVKVEKETPNIEVSKDITDEEKDCLTDYGWYGTNIYVEELMPATEYVVVLEYLNLKAPILEALLYEPDLSRSYSKDRLSSEGRLVFPLKQGEEGMYTIVLYGSGDIGEFTTYIVTRNEFIDLQKPNVDYPRDLMREDALIDE